MDVWLSKSMPPALDLLGAAADEYPWPIDPARLMAWTMADPTHARALHLKAEGVAGAGWSGADADRAAALAPVEVCVALALDLETYGNAWARVVRSRSGAVAGIERLPAWSMRRLRAGGHVSRVWDGTREIRTVYGEDETILIRQPSAMPGWYATPAWAAAGGVIELLEAITRANARLFAGGAVPDHIVTHTGGSLSDAQKAAIRDFFQREFQEAGRKTLFVSLTEGQTLAITPVAQATDGRYMDLYKAARETLPAAHGVPPRLLGIATPGALGGLSEAREQMHMFEIFSLAPRRRLLHAALAPVLAEAGVRDARLAAPDLTPPGADIASLPQMVAAGIMTPEEARRWMDLDAPLAKAAPPQDRAARARLIAELLDALGGEPCPARP